MRFKGTIVITDPCYINESTSPMSRDTIYGDWSCMVYPGNLADDEGKQKFNEWDEKYMAFWKEYNFGGKSDEEKQQMTEEFETFRKNWKKEYTLGEFCADSGQVAVFEWDKLSDKDQRWVLDHPWCATIIKDFFGDVEFVVKDKSVHVVGTSEDGEHNFYSLQSGF